MQQNKDMRFSDEMLTQFKDEFTAHIEKYEERIKTDDARFGSIIDLQHQNAEAIKTLIDETRDVVRIHRDLQGVARVGIGLQKFMVWCLKFGFIGGGVAAIVAWVIHYLEKVGAP